MRVMKIFSTSLVLCIGLAGISSPAVAVPSVSSKLYSNCSALNKVYPGGVAKSSSVKNKGGKTKKIPTVNAKVYSENASKDRDKDGIACEK